MEARRVAERILDVFYPPTCLSCGRDGAWMCEGCLRYAAVRGGTDEARPPFDAILTLGAYANPRIRRLLTTYKYQSAWCLDETVRCLLKRFRDAFIGSWPWAGESAMTVAALPTDPRHARERGFDHAEAIADAARDILVPWAERGTLLRRTRRALPNAKLPADATRKANTAGLFVASGPVPPSVLLVDDILTTGASAIEAGETLKRSGALRLYLLTLAKG